MTGIEVLNVVMARLGTGSGVVSINTELQSVLYDITSRADFYTVVSQQETVAGTIEYDAPAGLKRIYECAIDGGAMLEKKTYREYLKAAGDGSAAVSGEPRFVARRRDKLYFWPSPDAAYTINVDYAGYHPESWEDILLGSEFNEAIFEGVLAAVYRGQLFEKLRLNKKTISNRDILENVNQEDQQDTSTDADGTEGDEDVSYGRDFSSTTDTDDDSDSLVYEFDKDFPEITKHAEAYEAEIAKLIENLDMDMETILVEYRDI